jgi:hypothetical protein
MASEETLRGASRRPLARLEPTATAWGALALLLLVAGAFILYETRGTTFWVDEWAWVLHRRGNDLDTFLKPHNEHLSLIPVAIYKLMFATVGLEHYAPYRLLVIAAHLGSALLVFVYASRRVGNVAALCATALLLFLGPAWQNILWPFQIAWLISLAAGVGALLTLERGDRRSDMTACFLIAVSLASSGLGVALALGVIVELAWGRRSWRDLWIVAIPLVPYAIWWLAYRPAGLVQGNIDLAPHFAAESAAGTLSALVGLTGTGVPEVDTLQWGRPLGVVAAIGLLWLLGRYERIPPRVLGLLTIMAAFWVLTALRRAMLQQPDASRYLYVGAVFVLLLASELACRARPTARLAIVMVVVAGAAVLSNAGVLRDGGRYLRSQAESARADLAAIELAQNSIPPGYVADFPGTPFILLSARDYLEAAKDYGSPAYSVAELAAAPDPARLVADAELIRIHHIGLRESPPDASLAGAPEVAFSARGSVSNRHGCVEFRPDAVRATKPAPELELTVPAAGLLVRTADGSARVDIRRFATGFSAAERNVIQASNAAVLRVPSDSASQPWRARITPQGRLSVCALR